MGSNGLAVCVVTRNEEDRLPDCLASVAFADETIVVDSGSTDRTREVASARGARVFERDWDGFAAQREFAVAQARNDWVLVLDADERLSEALRREIEGLRADGFGEAAAYSMPRCTRYLGRWIRRGGFYPDRKVRLYDRRRGRWTGTEPHPRVEVEGPVRRLEGEILHLGYRDLSEHLAAIDRYTAIMAEEMHRRGRRASALDLLVRPFARFARFYLLKAGFLDGWRGLLLASLAGQYAFLKYARLRALENGVGKEGEPSRTGPRS